MEDNPAGSAAKKQQARSLLQSGRYTRALVLYTELCISDPADTESWLLQAAIHAQLGNMANVIRCCRHVLTLQPEHEQALYNMGVALQAGGDFTGARTNYERLLKTRPDHAPALGNLGQTLLALDRPAEALELLRSASRLQPDNSQLFFSTGKCQEKLGNLSGAASAYRAATQKDPRNFIAFNNLGNVLKAQGQIDSAISAYGSAVRINPDTPITRYNLCITLFFAGRYREAIQQGLKACQLEPSSLLFKQALAQALDSAPDAADESLRGALIDLFRDDRIDLQLLHNPAVSILKKSTGFSGLLDRLTDNPATSITADLDSREMLATINDPLFTSMLAQTVFSSEEIEHLVTALRNAFLDLACTGEETKSQGACLPAACAIACQCFNNEYVCARDEPGTKKLAQLKNLVKSHLQRSTPLDERLLFQLAALGSFSPLSDFPETAMLSAEDAAHIHPLAALMLERLSLNELSERRIRQSVPAITPVHDRTSDKVRNQYEDSPYPRWISFTRHEARPYREIIAELFPGFSPPDFGSGQLNALIAGCGTGRHALIEASRFADCNLLAVDLSRTSLAYAVRQAQYYGTDNVEFAQADILELGTLVRRFQIIESVGVLHHMAEPQEGLNILSDLLEPGGLINIGLYSNTGRKHIRTAQALFAEAGIPANPDGIRKARAQIQQMQTDNPVRRVMQMQDFYSMSECRDLLFHVQETCYDLPEISQMISAAGLRFIGFAFSDPRHRLRYHARFPNDPGMTNLDNWHNLEQEHPETFLEMYTFWCQKPA